MTHTQLFQSKCKIASGAAVVKIHKYIEIVNPNDLMNGRNLQLIIYSDVNVILFACCEF